jgi:RHS repeat-associated protein
MILHGRVSEEIDMKPIVAAAYNVFMTKIHHAGAAILLFLLLAGQASAQIGSSSTDGSTPLGLAPGAPAGSYALSGFDNINPYNGGLNFRLPLLHLGGRGSIQHTITLPLERHWRTIKSGTHAPFTYYPKEGGWVSFLPGYGAGVMVERLIGVNDMFSCQPVTDALTRLTFTAPDGTEYEFHDVLYNGAVRNNYFADDSGCHIEGQQPTNRGRVFVTADGSAATFVSDTDIYDFCMDCPLPDYGGVGVTELRPTGNLMMRDGTLYRIEQGEVTYIRDRNGNLLTFTFGPDGVTKITDSLKREVNIAYIKDAQNNPVRNELTYKGFGGNLRTVTVNYGHLDTVLRQGFVIQKYGGANGLFPELGGSPFNDFDPLIVTSVGLPNNKSYHFYYNSFGELARVILPTGGAFEYDYAAGLKNGPLSGSANSCGGKEIYRRVVEKRTYVDGQGLTGGGTLEGKMTFSRPEDINGGNDGYVDVFSLNPHANDAVMAHSRHFYFGSTRASWCREPKDYSKWQDGKEWRTRVYNSTGAELQRIENTWQQPVTGSIWPLTQTETDATARPNNPQITDTTTTLYATVAGESDQVAYQNFAFDQYTNETDVYEYDFGPGAHGTLIRRSHTDYLTTNNGVDYAADPSIHLRSLPALQWVSSDAAGNSKKAQTAFEYDIYTTDPNHAGLTPRSTISGLDSTYIQTAYQRRGNPTATTRYLLTNGVITGSIVTYPQYDVAGNVVKSIDGRGYASTFDFSDAYGTPDGNARGNETPLPTELQGQSTYAFPTVMTVASGQSVAQVSYLQYDYYLGRPINGEDPNGVIVKGDFRDDAGVADLLDRPRQIVRAVGNPTLQNRTLYSYDDTSRIVSTQDDLNSYQDGLLKSETVYDGLGRTTEARHYVYEPSNAYIVTRQTYDEMGRVSQTSNPYRPATESVAWTTTVYDGMNRLVSVTTPDGAVATTIYSANNTKMTDPALIARRSLTDGAGRLVRVDEPDGNGNLGAVTAPAQATNYVYDALDNLMSVTQGTQPPRTFGYDSLKRLTSANNPESGTVAYDYDNNGNLLHKTDSRSPAVTTTHAYDALNRVTSRTYSDPTPSVNFYYDNQTLPYTPPNFSRGKSIGRVVATTYGSGNTNGSYTGYNDLGRSVVSVQRTENVDYRVGYEYNLVGGMISETYPSGRVITTSYDSAEQLTTLSGQKAGEANKTYASQLSYASHGAVSTMQLGNQKWEHANYNNRLQPTQIGLGTSSSDSSLLKLDYTYSDSNPVIHDNNGNVRTQAITAPKMAGGTLVLTQTYNYDSLNRLQSASENGTPSWQQIYDYDRWGNRAVRNTSYTPSPSLTPQSVSGTDFSAFDQSKNRLSVTKYPNVVYDEVGTLTRDIVTSTFAYDAENRQVTASVGGVTASYSYDGAGQRVKKAVGSVTTIFVYRASGQLIAEYTSDPLPPTAGGGGTSYLTRDHLGSTRVVTKADGTIKARYDYLPYGEEIPASIGGRGLVAGYGGADSTRQKFTAKERDNESGLDYLGARYYSSAQGRFTSADEPLAGQEAKDPQTWNLYAYTSNNPLNRVDPDGRRWFYKEEKGVITDIKWVNPNDDGTYTSPGEGWMEFIPSKSRPVLRVKHFNDDGVYVGDWFLGEGEDGSPRAGHLWRGDVKDATMDLVIEYLLLKGAGFVGRAGITAISRIGAGAAASWRAYQFARIVAGLERLAASGGPTVRVVTYLTRAPGVGRALSVATGPGAEALARSFPKAGGQLFGAQIPKALLVELEKRGLADTLRHASGALEIKFKQDAARYIVQFFR